MPRLCPGAARAPENARGHMPMMDEVWLPWRALFSPGKVWFAVFDFHIDRSNHIIYQSKNGDTTLSSGIELKVLALVEVEEESCLKENK